MSFLFLGVIQAIHPDEHPDYNRICKEIIVFQAKHLEILEALLHIDTTAAPKQQVRRLIKLNLKNDSFINFVSFLNISVKLCFFDSSSSV